jgi:hypothetical protein|tara:strand:+ start:1412 stop:1894 length:483 start_codon:yes stop_codon:yes gene_type:complete
VNHTITNIYEDYNSNVEDIDKNLFKELCFDFNEMVIDMILEGGEFNMGNNLSTISILRMDRDPQRKVIDWIESNKYKSELVKNKIKLYDASTGEGTKWHIYYTDEYYCKYYWYKGRCKVKNKSVYRFDASRGIKGNKEKLTRLLRNDDLAYLRFKKNGSI